MATPSMTITIETQNPANSEVTTIKKGPYIVSENLAPEKLLHAVIGVTSTIVLGLNSHPNAKCISPILLFDDTLMYNCDKFKINTSQSQAYLRTTIKSHDGNFSFLPQNIVASIEPIRKPQPTIFQSILAQDHYESLTPPPIQNNL